MERDFVTKSDGVKLEVHRCNVQITDHKGVHPTKEMVYCSMSNRYEDLSIDLTKKQARKLASVLMELSK